jgi:hypothetical protein
MAQNKKAAKAAGKAADKVFMKNLSKAVKEEAARQAAAPKPAKVAAATTPPTGAKSGAKKPAVKKVAASGASTRKSAPPARKARAGTAKATPAGKKGDQEKNALAKELKSLLGKLDADGLAFLLEQARVHLYNMEAERLDQLRAGVGGKDSAGAKAAPPRLRIERSESGSSFYIILNNAYTMFTYEEMLALVRIAHSYTVDGEAAKALEGWMERERRDALSELYRPVSAEHPFCELARLIRKTFKAPPPRS